MSAPRKIPVRRRRCTRLARSRLFGSARALWERNRRDFRLSLTRRQKLWITLYLALEELGRADALPSPTAEQAHRAEIEYPDRLGTLSRTELNALGLRKPFWSEREQRRFLSHYLFLIRWLNRNGFPPPARLLEIGCGAGWLAELLALNGYRVLGTTLDPATAALARAREPGVRAKRPDASLEFRPAAMESLDEAVPERQAAEVVYLYEALHHVHDPRRGLDQAFRSLAPGGVLLILNEPGFAHAFRSLRVARLTGTREVGISARRLRRTLRATGFSRIHTIRNRFFSGFRPVWVAAWKPGRLQ